VPAMADIRAHHGVTLGELNIGGGHGVPYLAGDPELDLRALSADERQSAGRPVRREVQCRASESARARPGQTGDHRRTPLRRRLILGDESKVSAPFFLLTPEWARLPMVLLASYFLSKLELTRGTAPTMAKWRKRLFIATSIFSTDASVYFGLPPDRTVIMGERIEV
jgi:hypothetical protein